jgi:DNA-binding transcriptional LysR family regulator
MFDWNDLKYFLAVARHGSTLAAAKALRVNQSTVQRRLEELERRLRHQLVQRHPTGYRLTELGSEMLAHGEHIEDAIAAFERRLATYETELKGTVRLTCPEAVGSRLVRSSVIDKFHSCHPGLRVELVMSDKVLDLAKGQADIAIRANASNEKNLYGRRIADSLWALYASTSYIERHGRVRRQEDINDHAIVVFDGDLSFHQGARWLRSVAPKARIAARSGNLTGVLSAVKSGAGLAPLPIIVGTGEKELEQVLGPISDLTTGFYLLMHRDMRRTPRIRAFFDFIIDELKVVRPILSGRESRR